MKPILVLGATGSQGGAVARELLAAGRPVNAMVRNPDSAGARTLAGLGASLRIGDLDATSSLRTVFKEVDTVYAVTTPFAGGTTEEEQQGLNIIAAAETVRLPWLILASVASAGRANVPHFESKARIEARLRNSSLAWTIVAPTYFYENVLGVADSIAAGTLPMPLSPGRRLQQVALSNLGAVIASILTRRDEHLGLRIEIAGDDPTPAEMAGAVGVQLDTLSIDDIGDPDLSAMYRFLAAEGYSVNIEDVRSRYPDVPWITFANWARRMRTN